ncbi:MAG: hypothetical protein K6T71_03975 [Candidatus Bipolaricaulota bacterium]|nr:hypothetical protein [Candidatus Bipolaricaulota bacterium]
MAKNLTLAYAPSSDEMNIHFGEVRKAIAKEIEDEVYLRFDPQTREVVGLTVLHFRARFGKAKAEPLSLVLPVLAHLKLPKKMAEALGV